MDPYQQEPEHGRGMMKKMVMLPLLAGAVIGGFTLVMKIVDRARQRRSMRARSREAAMEQLERARESARGSVERARGPMHRGLSWTRHRVSKLRHHR